MKLNTEKTIKSTSWFFERIDKIDKFHKSRKKGDMTQISEWGGEISEMRRENDFTTDSMDIKMVRKEYYELPYAQKFDNLDEMKDDSLKDTNYQIHTKKKVTWIFLIILKLEYS